MERQTARGKRRNGAGAQVRGYRTAEAKDKGSTAGRILRAQTTRARSSTPPHGKGDGDCAWEVANQLETETVGEETTYYHYDGCGNTIAKQEPSGTTYFVYDTQNLLTRIDFADDTHNYFSYDADSKRVSGETSEGYREYVYQGPDMLKLQLERDEGGDTIAQYTMADGLESMRRDNASRFYHYNHLGTTLALTGVDEAVTDTWQHDAWGVELERTGTTVNPHTYVGEHRYYRMEDAGLFHLGAKDYGPAGGRFRTGRPPDGYGEGGFAMFGGLLGVRGFGLVNGGVPLGYAYVGNNPGLGVDALGFGWDPTKRPPDPPPGTTSMWAWFWPAYWEYYIVEPLDPWYRGCKRDLWECLSSCIREMSLVARLRYWNLLAGLMALLPIPVRKQLAEELGLLARPWPGFGAGPITNIGSIIAHQLWGMGYRGLAVKILRGVLATIPKLLIPLAGWEAGNAARCLGKCL